MSELFGIARIAGRLVAVPAEQVGSVVDIGTIVPAPLAPGAVLGLAALRSRVVTVVDPRVLLGLPATQPLRRAIVLAVDAHHYAFLVDAVEDVATFDRRPLAAGLTLGGCWAMVAGGMVERGGEALLVADLAALVPALGAAA